MLYIVGTPIGNLQDLSPRAREVLEQVEAVACEDTRRTGLLLNHLGIKQKLISYHEHNRKQREGYLLELLKNGQDIALVSDAGMPCISDPGEHLVKAAVEVGLEITVVPGPVAAVSALALSGLPAERFIFEGFLPSSGKERRQRLEELATHTLTFILYEAPHRLVKTLTDLMEQGLGDRSVAIGRELTKKYEEVIRLSIKEAAIYFQEIPPKGEFVLVVAPGKPSSKAGHLPQDWEGQIEVLLLQSLSVRDISSQLSKAWDLPKNQVYQLVLAAAKQQNNSGRDESS